MGVCGGECATDADSDGICDDVDSCVGTPEECPNYGCTDATACNFDSTANVDDDSCEFVSCQWCDDPEACNYEGEGFAWTAPICARTLRRANAIAMEMCLMRWAFAVENAWRMKTETKSVTTTTTVWGSTTNAAYAMEKVLCTNAVAQRFRKGIAIAMGTSLMRSGFVEARV